MATNTTDTVPDPKKFPLYCGKTDHKQVKKHSIMPDGGKYYKENEVQGFRELKTPREARARAAQMDVPKQRKWQRPRGSPVSGRWRSSKQPGVAATERGQAGGEAGEQVGAWEPWRSSSSLQV